MRYELHDSHNHLKSSRLLPFVEHSLFDVPLEAICNSADAGYGITEAVLARREILDLVQALESPSLKRSPAGARHLMRHPVVSTIAIDSRLLTIARAFLKTNPIPYRATLFDKSTARNWLVPWHQDTALPLCERRDVHGWGPWSIKAGITHAHAPATVLSRVIALRLHFDDSRADNGPLRVLPRTHALGVLSDADIERCVGEIPSVECVVRAGGIVAMRPLIVHASSKAKADVPRRVLHIKYTDSLNTADGLRIATA
jgi:ectoine hydroxylase-related dioxygenase (phytanoyl-CoA dioxygenase family)